MSLMNRHMGIALWSLILVSGLVASFFLFDLTRALWKDATPSIASRPIAQGAAEGDGPAIQPKERYNLIAKRNLFVLPEATAAGKAQKQGDRAPTTLNVRLKATIVSPHGVAWAMIQDPAQRKEDLYRVGDEIQGAEIVEIKKEEVVLRRNGELETLTLFTGSERAGSKQPPRSIQRIPRRSSPTQTARASSTASATARSRRSQQKIRSLMAQLRLRPRFKGGKPVGFAVGQVREGSVFEAAGLRRGDVIVAINDEDVRSPNQLLKAYKEIAEDEEIWMDILRNGEEDSVEIDLEGLLPTE